jgi:uncharacterized membrane protein
MSEPKRKWTKDEIAEFRKRSGANFYNNPEDANLFVPKIMGIGWTINWANPFAWLIALTIVGLVVWSSFFK